MYLAISQKTFIYVSIFHHQLGTKIIDFVFNIYYLCFEFFLTLINFIFLLIEIHFSEKSI